MLAISHDLQLDIYNYIAFVIGQGLFLLKRAGSAVRNPKTLIKTRGEYFAQNWDTIIIRMVIEFPFFYAWRHYSVAQLAAVFGWAMPTGWTIPNNPITAFFLGYAADSLLDWLSMSKKLPEWLRAWLAENVPSTPVSAKLDASLEQAAEGAKQATEAIAKAQDQVPKV